MDYSKVRIILKECNLKNHPYCLHTDCVKIIHKNMAQPLNHFPNQLDSGEVIQFISHGSSIHLVWQKEPQKIIDSRFQHDPLHGQ